MLMIWRKAESRPIKGDDEFPFVMRDKTEMAQ
jgi:hypothetical protein